MTEPEPETTGEPEELLMEEGEYLAGGIELHARCVEQGGRPGVDFTFQPTVNDRDIPDGIKEFNRLIEAMCQITVAKFPDPRTLGRFYREVKKDGAQDRCWYRITVTASVGADDQIKERIADAIDPLLVKADPHVRFRAKQLRAMLQRSMKDEGDVDGLLSCFSEKALAPPGKAGEPKNSGPE